jgi:putative ABC transport system substrate-binding protein
VGIEAVLKATRSIPTVFVMVGNPVGSGYVTSLARPGGNVTGFSAFEPEIIGKWMQVLKEIAPATKHVAVLFYPGYEFLWPGAAPAAAALGLEVMQATCRNAAEIERAISELARRPNGALVVLPTPLFAVNRNLIIRLAALHRLPAVYPFRYYATVGGLMSYGIDATDIFKRASLYVDRILKGENPGDLPVQAPTKFELAINLKTAKTLGLNVPLSLLGRADEVIE